ncbi:hypothetical protein ACFYYL_41200 [Actinomadura geliboluensis]|uniref:hypothetical protein n=1 Tax=Actinomadura geliboluensis TaxID=882440 RepID=UPI0036A4EBD5
MTLACRLLGHRLRFTSEGNALLWTCDRKCGAGGAKEYETAADAARYARAFNREDREDLGRRAPLIGLFPLRLFRAFLDHHRGGGQESGSAQRR